MSAPAADPLGALVAFRAALYRCIGRRRDALFERVDALLTAEAVASLAHLSLAPAHRRGGSSLYAALRRGRIDAEALRGLLLCQPGVAGPPVDAVDVSIWPRRNADTSPDRGL